MTLGGTISGGGGVTINSGAFVTLGNASNSFSGGINISGGTVAFGSGSSTSVFYLGSTSLSNPITYNNGTLLYSGSNINLSSRTMEFSGSGTIIVTNTATSVSMNPTNFSGSPTLTFGGLGQVFFGSNNSTFTPSLVIGSQTTMAEASWRFPLATGLTVQNGGQFELFINSANASIENVLFPGTITLNGTGPANPAGITGNSGALLYAPFTTALSGSVSSPIYLQTTSSFVVGNGTSTTNGTGRLYVLSNISGPGGMTKDYVSGLIGGRQGESADWGNSQGILILGGNNSYEGNTTINSGTVLLASPNALPPSTSIYIDSQNGSTLDLGGQSATVGGLYNGQTAVAQSPSPSSNGLAWLLVTSGGLFTGTVQDGASPTALSIALTGVLILGGSNTSTGGFTVNQGTLQLAKRECCPERTR